MPASATPRLCDAFDPRVTEFHTDAFSLAEDLDWLDRQRVLQAPVGMILHSSRILEVLVRQATALSQLGNPRDGLNYALRRLVEYECLSRDAYRLLDRLRDLGNKARHVLRKVNFDDAEQGYAILLRGLQWYFCEFPGGPALPCLSAHNKPLYDLLPSGPATLLKMLDADLDARGFLDALHLERRHCPVLASPVLAAVVAERLLDGDAGEQAQGVLTAARVRFPDDVRLRQLQGLLWSRAGRLEEACAWLEAIETTDSAADEETLGILAGAYKKRATSATEQGRQWLQACHAKYERGWRQSQGTNTYLGVNAAATALWLGLPGQTEPIAASIRTLLEDRQRRLAQADGGPARQLNCWDQLTLAEVHLLLQRWDDARGCYREAVERFPHLSRALQVAREQANRDLEALGRPELIGDVFPG